MDEITGHWNADFLSPLSLHSLFRFFWSLYWIRAMNTFRFEHFNDDKILYPEWTFASATQMLKISSNWSWLVEREINIHIHTHTKTKLILTGQQTFFFFKPCSCFTPVVGYIVLVYIFFWSGISHSLYNLYICAHSIRFAHIFVIPLSQNFRGCLSIHKMSSVPALNRLGSFTVSLRFYYNRITQNKNKTTCNRK